MIHTKWFNYAPHRAWQYWFWIRVDKERKRKRIRVNSPGIGSIVDRLDKQLYLPKDNVSYRKKT